MKKDIQCFLNKSEILSVDFKEVNYVDFYRDIFPIGSFQINADEMDSKGNGLAVEIRKGDKKSKHHLITDNQEQIVSLIDLDFVVTSPTSYFGRNRTSNNSTELYGMTFDLDGVSEKSLGNLLHQIKNNQNPRPTYIVNSGHGLHLYYIFEKPIKLYNHIKEPLKLMKYELTDRLWNIHTSEIKEKQFQGINQGFRMVGSPSKFGKDYRLRAFKTGDKISLDYLNSFITENKVIELDYKSNLTLEQAKEKYPEWYERKIVKGISAKKTWNVKRDLYDWWKRKIIEGATYGHRYFCIMVLAIYAQKCGIEESELKRDAYELMPILNDRDEEPFTEQDIKSALKSYKENYKTFPRKDIEKITAIAMPANKRNYRTQEMHLKGARAIQEINNPDWRNKKGRPTKENKVLDYIKKNPNANPTQIAKALNISRPTVYKYLKK